MPRATLSSGPRTPFSLHFRAQIFEAPEIEAAGRVLATSPRTANEQQKIGRISATLIGRFFGLFFGCF